MLGTTELIIIFAILVFIFGLGKLPKAARQIGQSVRSFQNAAQGMDDEIEVGKDDEESEAPKLEDKKASQAARDASVPAQNETAGKPSTDSGF